MLVTTGWSLNSHAQFTLGCSLDLFRSGWWRETDIRFGLKFLEHAEIGIDTMNSHNTPPWQRRVSGELHVLHLLFSVIISIPRTERFKFMVHKRLKPCNAHEFMAQMSPVLDFFSAPWGEHHCAPGRHLLSVWPKSL